MNTKRQITRKRDETINFGMKLVLGQDHSCKLPVSEKEQFHLSVKVI